MFNGDEVVELQLLQLKDERRSYVARVNELIYVEDRSSEIQAYLRMIEAINDAAVKLARDWQKQSPAGMASSAGL